MDFSAAIDKIMPDVRDGSNEPFILFRDGKGEWHCDYTENQYGEQFDWVHDVKENDPLALVYRGRDFSKASFSSVYDTVLCHRISAEASNLIHSEAYGSDSFEAWAKSMTENDLKSLSYFFNDNVASFSSKVTEYLISHKQPFIALTELCPYNMGTDESGQFYNEKLTEQAIKFIEAAVRERIKEKPRSIGRTANDMPDMKIYPNEYKPILTTNLIGWQVTLAENKDKEHPYLVELRREPDKGIWNDTYFCGVTADYLEAMSEFTKQLQFCVGVANSQRNLLKDLHRIDYVELKSSDCLPDSRNSDYTGKLLIVDPNELMPEYRSSENQLVLCTHGNGARPDAIGTSVFCKELHTGASVCFARYMIAGVADPEKLPQWARIKMEIRGDSSIFEYGGYHFKPLRKFGKGEITKDGTYTDKVARGLNSDREAGISKYKWKKDGVEYSHESFYAASGDNECDIFRCIENGKLYIPGENELFQYIEPPQKERAKKEKTSLTSQLDDAKAEAAAHNEQTKSLTNTVKRGDKEV